MELILQRFPALVLDENPKGWQAVYVCHPFFAGKDGGRREKLNFLRQNLKTVEPAEKSAVEKSRQNRDLLSLFGFGQPLS